MKKQTTRKELETMARIKGATILETVSHRYIDELDDEHNAEEIGSNYGIYGRNWTAWKAWHGGECFIVLYPAWRNLPSLDGELILTDYNTLNQKNRTKAMANRILKNLNN